ncbi:hypothetical protein, partial [Neisseria sp. HMSC074B07]|uniref:hypothetical protein n=1 Tax=Neisseria sp. HMSC074B07 TaxID=1715205 RepID=UPI001AEF63F6
GCPTFGVQFKPEIRVSDDLFISANQLQAIIQSTSNSANFLRNPIQPWSVQTQKYDFPMYPNAKVVLFGICLHIIGF